MFWALLGSAWLAGLPTDEGISWFMAPIRVRDAKGFIDTLGHAAPFFGDLDGDGLPDLLVGQLQGGMLRVYRNQGTRGAPRFEGYTFLKVENKRFASIAGG